MSNAFDRANRSREKGDDMNPYTILSSGVGTHEATGLSARLSAWHDAMVAHERRLRSRATSDACDDECPHAEARTLWKEALAAFGERARELIFLRSRAHETRSAVRASWRSTSSEPITPHGRRS